VTKVWLVFTAQVLNWFPESSQYARAMTETDERLIRYKITNEKVGENYYGEATYKRKIKCGANERSAA
jgi:hypothetical protein